MGIDELIKQRTEAGTSRCKHAASGVGIREITDGPWSCYFPQVRASHAEEDLAIEAAVCCAANPCTHPPFIHRGQFWAARQAAMVLIQASGWANARVCLSGYAPEERISIDLTRYQE